MPIFSRMLMFYTTRPEKNATTWNIFSSNGNARNCDHRDSAIQHTKLYRIAFDSVCNFRVSMNGDSIFALTVYPVL